MGIIYSYTNLTNQKRYIGQTITPEQRIKAHRSGAYNTNDSTYDSPFHRAIRKYGWDNFHYEVLAEADSIDLLNKLEIFYIQYYKTQIPTGYNILAGGHNASITFSEEAKEKMRWSHSELTKDEVVALRLAYANNESPKKIYEEQYKDRLNYNAFLNIWSGRRYATVMPEVIEMGRHTKLTEDQVKAILIERRDKGTSYQKLGEKYGVTRGAIEGIVKRKTWKHVQIEPVSTIPESGE